MKKIVATLLAILFLAPASTLARDKVLMSADRWCPYNCEPNTDYEGFLVEIARMAFAKIDTDVVYTLQPWTTCIDEFNHKQFDKIEGIIGAAETDVQDPNMPSKQIVLSYVSAFTLNNTDWSYVSPDSLGNHVLGIIEGYTYPDDLKAYVFSNYVSHPELFYISTNSDNATKDEMDKMESGDIFTYVEDESVVNYYTKTNNLTNVRKAGLVQQPMRTYILFSKNHPKSELYTKLMNDIVYELEANGKMKELIKKYNIVVY